MNIFLVFEVNGKSSITRFVVLKVIRSGLIGCHSYRDKFDELNSFQPEEKKDFLVGILEKIGVRTIDSQTHQLDLTFKIPVVGDKLVWKDPKSKPKGGYEIIKGKFSKRVLVDSGKLKKRKRSPVEVIGHNKTTQLLLNSGEWWSFFCLCVVR
jgi:hypothetical protein